jgi:hypothetical protein
MDGKLPPQPSAMILSVRMSSLGFQKRLLSDHFQLIRILLALATIPKQEAVDQPK